MMLAARPASTIYGAVGPRRMILAGLITTALTTFALMRLDLGTNEWLIRALMLVRGLGFGLVLVPLQAATYATVALKDAGRATALYNGRIELRRGDRGDVAHQPARALRGDPGRPGHAERIARRVSGCLPGDGADQPGWLRRRLPDPGPPGGGDHAPSWGRAYTRAGRRHR
jgi:hypothetical protein